MAKELIEDLLIEFDEMGFEPTTLCDTKKEIDSFRNRLKQVLDYLKAIDNAKSSEFKIVNYKGQYYLQINVNDDEATQIQLPLLEDEIKDVQLAIDKFKQINLANPSEALECLEKIVDKGRINDGNCCHWRECLSKNKCNFNNDNLMCPDYTRANTIKQALLKAQEQEKVLKVIKEKKVEVNLFYTANCSSAKDYNGYIRLHYSCFIWFNDSYYLTEEEFDLLKRYFNENI